MKENRLNSEVERLEFPPLALSPHGELYFQSLSSFQSVTNSSVYGRIQAAFSKGVGEGLSSLGLWELNTKLPAELTFWRQLSQFYFSQLCSLPGIGEKTNLESVLLPPPQEVLAKWVGTAPPMQGGEYVNIQVLKTLWDQLHAAFQAELLKSAQSLQEFFSSRGISWNLVGRVCFHLAEVKNNEDFPFAFLATYSHRLSEQGKVQYLPLSRALEEYSGQKNQAKLLQLLLPIQKAAEKSSFLKALVDSEEIFHPLSWTPEEAFHFLKSIPFLEESGIVVRVPNWWQAKSPPRPQVSVTVGDRKTSILGLNSMLKFSVAVSLEGEELSEKELKSILSSTVGLALIRGKWVEIDRDQLKTALEHWKRVQKSAEGGEISFIQGMRLLSGVNSLGNSQSLLPETGQNWTQIRAGDELLALLEQLKDPDGQLKQSINLGEVLNATLRPYQQTGVRWLWFLNRLGLGACLADDMGLGKTIQVISLFLLLKKEGRQPHVSSLLVVPASLLENWKSEIQKFAPSLRYFMAHSSLLSPQVIPSSEVDVVITTYGYLNRCPWIKEASWDCIILDEAQAIKNAGTLQTRTVKLLRGRHRIALTGTPVENRLGDLWSLYDFINPGLLGTAKEFTVFTKAQTEVASPFAALRSLIRPYLLRRLKTDPKVISDLPDKTEIQAYCPLSKKQAALYQESVEELTSKIALLEGIQRRGVILSFLIRFKQICNHPSQWLSDGHYDPQDSGKFSRLREICESIAAKQEKVLVFTQFREMTDPLSEFLTTLFGQAGLILHGGTPVKKRKEYVDAFQKESGPPFFILSLKAGGTGLNLTSASHVIHFDRWWNPAVENQASDRAYRIGQKKNVLVYKFICKGTIEEKIDEMIASKQNMSNEILSGSAEMNLTELKNEEILKLVSLDLQSAAEEVVGIEENDGKIQ